MGVYTVRTFVRLGELLASNTVLSRKLDELERKCKHHDDDVEFSPVSNVDQRSAPNPDQATTWRPCEMIQRLYCISSSWLRTSLPLRPGQLSTPGHRATVSHTNTSAALSTIALLMVSFSTFTADAIRDCEAYDADTRHVAFDLQ